MTSPPEWITVECPRCGVLYRDWHRASINLDLDDLDEEYLRQATTARCPSCKLVVKLSTLVVEGDVWRFPGPRSWRFQRRTAEVRSVKFYGPIDPPETREEER